MNATVRTLTLLLAGAATGAAVALLTAPQPGRETRRKIKHATGDLTSRASRVASAIQEAYVRGTEAGKVAFVSTLRSPSMKASESVTTMHH